MPGSLRDDGLRKAFAATSVPRVTTIEVDGFRIDTLMYVERETARVFGNAVREHALTIGKRNFFTFGEVW